MQSIIKRYFLLNLFLIGAAAFAQEEDQLGSETVVIVKPYTPSVGDAFKIKEVPPSSDSLAFQKQEVQYEINSVPVASTFEPEKGRAANLERDSNLEVYDSYATLGFGSYTSALAEFYTNFEIGRTDNFGIFLEHNSSQGGIEDVQLNDSFYDTDLNFNYASRNRNRTWKAEAGVHHRLINWYGLPENISFSEDFLDHINPQQNYLNVYAGASVALEDSFFKSAELGFSHFSDSYNSSEIHAILRPSFEFEVADEIVTTTIIADYLKGNFENNFGNAEYGFLNTGINPSLLILRNNLTLYLGVAGFYSMNMESSDSKFYIFPKVSASYRIVDEFLIAYANLQGDLEQNSYSGISAENPYIAPLNTIKPTEKLYDASLGIKGKLMSNLSFNLRGSYISENNKVLFTSFHNGGFMEVQDYEYGNAFRVLYDDMKTLSAFGELNMDFGRNFSMGVNVTYLNYKTTNAEEAWHLPNLKASLLMDYQIGEHWFAGASLFYRGERKALRIFYHDFGMPGRETYNLDAYLDANLRGGYRFNEQLSAFVKVNNLLGSNYEKWLDYPVQGLQVLAGATYKFDF